MPNEYPYRAPTDAELVRFLELRFGTPIILTGLLARARRQFSADPHTARTVYRRLYNSDVPPPIEQSYGYVAPPVSSAPVVTPWACADCSSAHIGPDAALPLHTHYGEAICADCADENYTRLENGTYAPNDDVTTCRTCDSSVLSDDTHNVDDESVCAHCVEHSWRIVRCQDDDMYHFRNNVFCCDSDGEYYADIDNMPSDDDDDRDDKDESGPPIYDYSANVLNILGKRCFINSEAKALDSARSALVMGVELETDCRERNSRSEIAMALLETSFSKYGICKTDGTVTGPECVTLPADLESHRKLYKWAEWCKVLSPIARGFYGTEQTGAEGCGIHVHINRTAVSPLTAGKMMVFMNREDNRAFIELIAQRAVSQNGYCKFKHDKKLTSGRQTNDDRYEALNITPHTIEVRIFRANLSASRIMKNLEFCHALTQWAAQESAQELGAERFRAWIHMNHVAYPELVKFIASRTEDK